MKVNAEAPKPDVGIWYDGYWCLERCIGAAALHLRIRKRPFPHSVREARLLTDVHGLPDVDGLARRMSAKIPHYRDPAPLEEADPDELITAIKQIEQYVKAVGRLLAR